MATTTCASCGEANPVEARFCINCGDSLVAQATTGPTVKLEGVLCPACGTLNPEQATYCVSCGRAVGGTAAQPKLAPRPTYQAPPQVYPRTYTPPAYVPRQQRHAPWHHWNPPLVGMIIAGLVLSAVLSRSGWPLFFLILPFGLLNGMFRGASGSGRRQYAPLFWMAGLLLLFVTKTFWPGILLLWLVWMILR